MTCKSCGASVRHYGCYCSRCGKRFRTDDEDEFLALNRAGKRFEADAFESNGYSNRHRIAANAAWRIAVMAYGDKRGRCLGAKDCPPDARYAIEKEASCILRVLDAEIYRENLT